MIQISYKGNTRGLMKYLEDLEVDEILEKENWTDLPEYGKDGLPSE